ncbi:YciI family protein [Streptomyces lushanensis]|uniref:YciI family protein n=1 Tax=Streptomyces lushanensis TaxID=1434255 RepID=UPI0008339CD5|nr:YciI family protein [Streptomyces lushanensis]
MSTTDETVDQLLAPMTRKRLFVAINRKAAPDADIAPYVADHLRYMVELERRGLLWASGPFVEPGVRVGDGLTIVNSDSIDEARELLMDEPLCHRGLRTFEGPFPWELREGHIPIALDASSSSFRLR